MRVDFAHSLVCLVFHVVCDRSIRLSLRVESLTCAMTGFVKLDKEVIYVFEDDAIIRKHLLAT